MTALMTCTTGRRMTMERSILLLVWCFSYLARNLVAIWVPILMMTTIRDANTVRPWILACSSAVLANPSSSVPWTSDRNWFEARSLRMFSLSFALMTSNPNWIAAPTHAIPIWHISEKDLRFFRSISSWSMFSQNTSEGSGARLTVSLLPLNLGVKLLKHIAAYTVEKSERLRSRKQLLACFSYVKVTNASPMLFTGDPASPLSMRCSFSILASSSASFLSRPLKPDTTLKYACPRHEPNASGAVASSSVFCRRSALSMLVTVMSLPMSAEKTTLDTSP
mmetsp:Transcript_8271/g.29032  ORF Transcript_8271/g.29032 Transcript_8271/m.29032 type:complete len:279 (+) Transcript_8271:1273-2109(+)